MARGISLSDEELYMNRKSNSKCLVCQREFYRRPSQKPVSGLIYCSSACCGKSQTQLIECVICGIGIPKGLNKKTCGRECSNKNRKGMKYDKTNEPRFPNPSSRRCWELKQAFNFTSCMVEGCSYNKTYDVHRHIPGSKGGEYIIGNMFAICPNHHAEVTRGIIDFEKVSDSQLKIKEVLS